ncbi:MAG: hypothetical protein QG597_1925 [Actinomycetota bacterium]|nr:hypothetical protein [Actinomycetota bacterium]
MSESGGGYSQDRPIIVAVPSESRRIEPPKSFPKEPKYGHGPGKRERLGAAFQEAAELLASRAAVSASLGVADPQLVLIMEGIDESIDLAPAARGLGIEILAESEDQVDLSEDEQAHPKTGTVSARNCLHALCVSERSMTELLRQWRKWEAGEELARPFTKLRDLFAHLRVVRPWGPQDRLLAADLSEHLNGLLPDRLHPVEVELWYRGGPTDRDRAQTDVEALILGSGGEVVGAAIVAQIGYHGLKCLVPADTLRDLAAGRFDAVELVRNSNVRYLRVSTQSATPSSAEAPVSDPPQGPPPVGAPVLCLIDGLPAANHPLLAGRVEVLDPDDLAASLTVEKREHGTWTSSVAVWGDLSDPGPPATRPVLVRPILLPAADTRDHGEEVPADDLVPDLMWRVFRELFEGDDSTPPAAPDVMVVNLSVGDPATPFDVAVSSWARMLDWLAYEYGVVIITAAGNEATLNLSPETYRDLVTLRGADRASTVAAAQARDINKRRIISPAESINAISVGAIHADASGLAPLGNTLDPTDGEPGISPVSRLGGGYRRSVKPELVAAGGRAVFREPLDDSSVVRVGSPTSTVLPGIRVAAPSFTNSAAHVVGTSFAAPLVARRAVDAHDLVSRLTVGVELSRRHKASAIKALLVHGAADLPGMDHDVLPREVSIGYGELARDFSLGCEDNEAVLLFFGTIGADEEQFLELPIPDYLNTKDIKQISATLAWLSPVNWAHRQYRRAKLDMVAPTGAVGRLVKSTTMPTAAAKRGATTVQSLRWETSSAIADPPGTPIRVRVQCRQQAGTLEGFAVDYAAVVSLWVAPAIGLDVYQQVRARVQPPVEVRV